MADDTEAALQALQDLARHDEPAVERWSAAAGVSRRDLAYPMAALQLMSFLRLAAVETLAAELEGEPPVSDDVLSSLGRAVEALRQVQFFASAVRPDGIDAGEWTRAMFSIEFRLRQHDVIRLEQEGRASQVTPGMLTEIRGLAGRLGAEKARRRRRSRASSCTTSPGAASAAIRDSLT